MKGSIFKIKLTVTIKWQKKKKKYILFTNSYLSRSLEDTSIESKISL